MNCSQLVVLVDEYYCYSRLQLQLFCHYYPSNKMECEQYVAKVGKVMDVVVNVMSVSCMNLHPQWRQLRLRRLLRTGVVVEDVVDVHLLFKT